MIAFRVTSPVCVCAPQGAVQKPHTRVGHGVLKITLLNDHPTLAYITSSQWTDIDLASCAGDGHERRNLG